MESLRVQKNHNFLNLAFLKSRISLPRLQKGHYISTAFVKNIEDAHYTLSAAININSKSIANIISSKLEKISDSMVNCCLYYMEEVLQELIAISEHQREKSKIFCTLENMAQGFYILSIYIRYSINPREFMVKQNFLFGVVDLCVPDDVVFFNMVVTKD